jgi:hypothetical protein
MKTCALLLSLLTIGGCVSGDCEGNCYLLELRKPDERLNFKCESTQFHPHCEP